MILRILLTFALLIVGLHASEAKRMAFVVGNNAYPNLPNFRQLQKAVNDARSMRDTLRDDLGFEVSFAEDADFRTMNNGFKNFEAKVEPGDVVFMYFSGHGVSIGGENFLLPSDIPVPVQGEEQRLIGSSFGAEQLVLRIKKRGARAIFAVLDACRDDPFESDTGKAVGGPSGLTKMDAAEGVFILFAAGVRQTALDRLSDADTNPNSLFTRSLIPALKTGGLSQIDLAKRVYKEVKAAASTIGHDQTPAYYDQIDGYVSLKEGDAAVPQVPVENTASQDWSLVQNSNSKAVLKSFIDKHGSDALYRGLAEEKMALLVPAKPVEAECSGVKTRVQGESTCFAIKETFTDCVGCPQMVVVPGGSFMMGSPADEKDRQEDEGPQHKVTLSNAFAVGKFEITRGQFAEFVKETNYSVGTSCWVYDGKEWKDTAGKSFRDPGYLQSDDHPAACVSWDDAQAYVKWLSKKSGVNYRLLTESEFEYANRAGTTTTFPTGTTITTAEANFNNEKQATTVVGSYSANKFGLFDMAGNVWEWTEDCYEDSYKNASTIGMATQGSSCKRVFRGGGWGFNPSFLRSANRYWGSSDYRNSYLGFRLARTF